MFSTWKTQKDLNMDACKVAKYLDTTATILWCLHNTNKLLSILVNHNEDGFYSLFLLYYS